VGQDYDPIINGALQSFSVENKAFRSGLSHLALKEHEDSCSRLSMPIFEGDRLWGTLVAFDYQQPSRIWKERNCDRYSSLLTGRNFGQTKYSIE